MIHKQEKSLNGLLLLEWPTCQNTVNHSFVKFFKAFFGKVQQEKFYLIENYKVKQKPKSSEKFQCPDVTKSLIKVESRSKKKC